MLAYIGAEARIRVCSDPYMQSSARQRHGPYDYVAANGLEVGRRRAIAILHEIKSVKFKRKIICQEDTA